VVVLAVMVLELVAHITAKRHFLCQSSYLNAD